MTEFANALPRLALGGLRILLMLTITGAQLTNAAQGERDEVALQLQQAAKLFTRKEYSEAGQLYLALSEARDPEQASWAFELYGVCLEKQGDLSGATTVYQQWLQNYTGSSGETRVKQRLLAVQTASLQPRKSAASAGRGRDSSLYGSASLMYRGLSREVEDQDRETPISSIAADVDLHMRATSGDWLWSGRINGGYLSNHADDGESDGRVSNLYAGVMHRATGVELVVGRRRSSDNGVYGYLDGATLTWPVWDNVALLATVGMPSTSSRESSESDRLVYALGAEFTVPDSALRLQTYAMEQEFDGLTERRALGGQVSWFNDYSRYFAVLDYDIEFSELNNFMFNGSWDAGAYTNLSLSMGYQRSPFLNASNAIIGEYELNLDEYIEQLEDGRDIYDAALDKTALSRYASLVVNRELAQDHRIIAEVYHFDLSDLPRYDFSLDAPDSDANTTFGLQYIWSDALLRDDTLSFGARYTSGDFSDSLSLYADEKIYFNGGVNLILRLRGSRRTMDEVDQDALTLRPAVRLDWYISQDLLLESELGYEWLMQDFGDEDFEVQQGFLVLGLRKRF